MRERMREMLIESARGLHKVGAIDKQTMRHYDAMRVSPVHPMSPAEIRHLREDAHMSQAVFAMHLNTSKSTVQKWEAGEKQPKGIALKLLNVVRDKGIQAIA